MKRKNLKLMVAALAVAMTAGIFTGCSSKTETANLHLKLKKLNYQVQ